MVYKITLAVIAMGVAISAEATGPWVFFRACGLSEAPQGESMQFVRFLKRAPNIVGYWVHPNGVDLIRVYVQRPGDELECSGLMRFGREIIVHGSPKEVIRKLAGVR